MRQTTVQRATVYSKMYSVIVCRHTFSEILDKFQDCDCTTGQGSRRQPEWSCTLGEKDLSVPFLLYRAAFFVLLFFSGPAVRYNAEFTKRIPVTGLGSSDLIISIIFLYAYLY